MIREHPRFQRTAIIFVSGVALDRARPAARATSAARWTTCRCRSCRRSCARRSRPSSSCTARRTQLEQLNRELESRVAERTAELEEASRRKDEFLAVLAHELRNPLAAIRTAAQLVGRADARTSARSTRRPASSAARSRTSAGSSTISWTCRGSRAASSSCGASRLKLSAVVFHAIETSQPLVAERRHTLSISAIDDRPRGDRRSGPADAGRREHPAQRREVHATGRPDRARRRTRTAMKS